MRKQKMGIWSLLALLLVGSFFSGLTVFGETDSELINSISETRLLFQKPHAGEILHDIADVEVEVTGPADLKAYIQRESFAFRMYLGEASFPTAGTWRFSWDTKVVPNGSYSIVLVAKIPGATLAAEGPTLSVVIDNKSPELTQEEQAMLEQQLQRTETEIHETDQIIEENQHTTQQIIDQTLQGTSQSLQHITQKTQELERANNELELLQKEQQNLEGQAQKLKEKLEEFAKADLEAREKEAEAFRRLVEEKEKSTRALQKQQEKLLKQKEELMTDQEEKQKDLQEAKDDIFSRIPDAGNLEEVAALIERHQQTVRKQERERIEKLRKLQKDSDLDGLEDKEELELGTNPQNPDTDNDGFLDGDEKTAGFNPKNPTAETRVVYQDPREVQPRKHELYKVERVELISLLPGKQVLRIEGTGIPNSFVTIHIFSTHLVVVTKTDEFGRWTYTLENPTEPGTHQVYVTVNDNTGNITARSEGFVFVQTANAVAEVSTLFGASLAPSPGEQLRQSSGIFVAVLVAISLVLAMALIGYLSSRYLRHRPF